MTSETVFMLTSNFALLGWIVLALAVFRKNQWLRDRVAGFWMPLLLAGLYVSLILLFFGTAEGGFATLADVQALFRSPWVALAGWVHYLAFDLFIGAWIARKLMDQGANRLWLVPLLPATFLFGPAGLAGYALVSFLTSPANKEHQS
jgi:hypothetical protein